MDGSPVTYTAWEKNEPNFANNDENCVTIYKNMGELGVAQRVSLAPLASACLFTVHSRAHAGFWNDINCGLELASICKRSSDFVNATVAPTAAPTGGCAPEWVAFQGKVRGSCLVLAPRIRMYAGWVCVRQTSNQSVPE